MLVLLVAISGAIASEIDTSKECFINYLRQHNHDDDVFNSTAYIDKLSEPCERRMTSEKASAFFDAHHKYSERPDVAPVFDCFIESWKEDENFKLLLLKKKAIESVQLTWKGKLNPKNWLPGKKHNAMKKVENQIGAIESENLFVCEYEPKFEAVFNSIVSLRDENFNKEAETCVTKFLQKRQEEKLQTTIGESDSSCIITINNYKLSIFNKLQGLFAHNKKKVRKCMSEALTVNDYFSSELKAKLIKADATAEKKSDERKIYVESMLALFRDVVENCRK